MLKIRETQLDKLDQAFEEQNVPAQMASLLQRSFPDECAALGKAGLMDRIEKGRTLANSYGIEKFANIVRFINLMFILGREDYDVAPETDWAGKILNWDGADEELKLAALEKRSELEFAKKHGFE